MQDKHFFWYMIIIIVFISLVLTFLKWFIERKLGDWGEMPTKLITFQFYILIENIINRLISKERWLNNANR